MNSIDIFLERMANIIFIENRPFCYKDFLSFELNEKEYKYVHGTIRNNFSELKKQNKIELVYQSPEAFYTLKGIDVGKSITSNHGEDHLQYKQKNFLTFLNELPMDKPAIHDIRLKFSVRGLWNILSSSSSDLISNKDLQNNKDITLYDINLKDHTIKTTVHKTDAVSVIIACSNTPISLDTMGLAKLSSGLTRVEDRLQRFLIGHYTSLNAAGFVATTKNNNNTHAINLPSKYLVPSHMSWTVIMWHFGQDSLIGYSGEKFEIQWRDGLQVFHIYSKHIHNNRKKTLKKIIRKEIQEYPNKSLGDAFKDNLE